MADPLRDYEMLEELGSGSFGVVYKARERATGELVAIKHIDLDGTDDDIKDIQQEIALLSTCSSPFVTKYKASFVRGVKLWIVMEFLGGGSCLDLLKIQPFAEMHAAIVCRELLLGLQYLHSSGKIHRDIKAANILLSHNGRVKIADFGVAAQITNIKSQRNTFVGTPFWMAPEVIQESGYDYKADIWSLGITTMELVQGEPPNADLHPMKALFAIPKNPSPRLDNRFSRELRNFVSLCLTKDPDLRPSAKELLQHKWIQRAGPVDGLRFLIQSTKQKQAQEEDQKHPRFYEETLRDMSRVDAKDDWVFDTVRPAPVNVAAHTMKRRRLADEDEPTAGVPTAMMQSLSLNRSTQASPEVETMQPRPISSPTPDALQDTMMRIPQHRPNLSAVASDPQSTTRKVSSPRKLSSPAKKLQNPPISCQSPNRKSSTSFEIMTSPTRQYASPAPQQPVQESSPQRRSSLQKQPLALDMSFGNGQSTHRLFRRVSDDSPTLPMCGDENLPPGPMPAEPTTKEAKVGRRIFTKVVDPAFQEVYAQTAGAAKQEIISRAGEAWAALDALDPEGELLLIRLMLDKIHNDPKLSRSLLPQMPPPQQQQQQQQQQQPQPRQDRPHAPHRMSMPVAPSSFVPESPQKATRLMLAQNNPHLKSHRRRQSSQVSLVSVAGERAGVSALPLPPAQTGMEQTRAVGEALYGRWLDGLKGRWPQAG